MPVRPDAYQGRYLRHKERKAQGIAQDGRPPTERNPERRSVRVFASTPVPRHILNAIFAGARQAPQSCNRQAITLRIFDCVASMNNISALERLLAGGSGWLGRAPVVVLLFADMAAYKSPAEVAFMPWLDAGVMMATLVGAAHELGVATCIVNPHVRPELELDFRAGFNHEGRLFCGAVAIGYPAITPAAPEKKPLEELVEW